MTTPTETPTCQKCKREYHLIEFDAGPTPHCDPCAHEMVAELTAQLEEARKALERLASSGCGFEAEYCGHCVAIEALAAMQQQSATAAQQREIDFRDSQIEMLQTQVRTERERNERLQEALTELLEWAEETEFAHKDDDGTWLWSKSGERIIADSALSHSGKEGV